MGTVTDHLTRNYKTTMTTCTTHYLLVMSCKTVNDNG